ncbi:MAG: hydroxymethylbilane synthase [Bryobacterales bacterium]
MTSLTIGTRGSQLALWQAHWVERQLQDRGIGTRIEIIKTTGDKITDVALAKVGAAAGLKGIFTKEIEEALLAGDIDLAVHSLKDLPGDLDERLALGAIPERADPRDALVGKTLAELPPGAKVGTSSLRRGAQLRHLRPDLLVENIRGNIDTRLRKQEEGLYDAILLAAAGLHRMGWQDRIAETLEPKVMAPAIGQGALGIEIRAGDKATRKILEPLNHGETATTTAAERALLRALGGGCQVPFGGYARIEGDRLLLDAVVISPDGVTLVRAAVEGSPEDPAGLGQQAYEQLRQQGAEEIIRSVLQP